MDVSIIIPVFNCLDLTRACLASLEKTVPRRVSHEVIIVDDGSTDGSREWFRTLPTSRYRVHFNNPPRQGYARNNNLGARLARGDVLCLLNNDTVLLPGWLTEMLKVLRAEREAGLVGNIQREPASGLIDHRGIVFNRLGNPVHVGKDTAVPPEGQFERWPAVTAACCVVRREVFLDLGGFDEEFTNGFEDVDLCLRAGERGLKHLVAHRSVIYHHISASPGRHARQRENLRRYRRRWGWRVLAWRHRERFLRRQAERRARLAATRAPAVAAETPEERAARERAHAERLARYRQEWSTEWNQRARERWQRAWEARREDRRQHRQDLRDAAEDGRRYLRKHWLTPWRYGFGRVCRALEQTLHPLPAAIPAPPRTGIRFSTPPPPGLEEGSNGNGHGPEETAHPKRGPSRSVPGGYLVFNPAEF